MTLRHQNDPDLIRQLMADPGIWVVVEHALPAREAQHVEQADVDHEGDRPDHPELDDLAHEDVDRPAEAACQVGEQVRHAASLVPQAGRQGTGAAAGTDILPR